MGIICTVLAMASPSLRGFFGSRRTADAAAQVVALARFAATQSAAEGRTYRLSVDLDAGTYWVTREQGNAQARLASEFGRTFSLPQGTRARWDARPGDPPRDYIEFLPDGRTETATLRLTGRRGEVYRAACLSPTERYHVVSAFEETH